jgi:glycosyltransferase involved in cell wall biosynthesis
VPVSKVPRFSVVTPVYNRQDALRRALQSVADQSLSDFECVVVDDGSTNSPENIVDEFDDRFIYVRRETNGGCTAARMTGLSHVRGEFVLGLDSDNELYPWAFERAAYFLDANPQADGVAGLCMFPDGLHVRLGQRVKLVGPEEYRGRTSLSSRADSVGIVRRVVADEWLQLRPDYYNLDFVFWLRFRLAHQLVWVDEPWGVYDTSSPDKIRHRPDPRKFEDIVNFVEDFRPLVGTTPCGPIDMTLSNMWVRCVRARRHREAALVADWMRERGVTRSEVIARKVKWRLRAQATRLVPSRAHVL